MDRLISKYMLSVYESGKTVMQELPIAEYNTGKLDTDGSLRIRCILQTLDEIKRIKNAKNESLSNTALYNEAVKNVAKLNGVGVTSVIDKLTRQIGLKTNEIRKQLFDAADGNIDVIRSTLLNNVSNHSVKEDNALIEYYFSNKNHEM